MISPEVRAGWLAFTKPLEGYVPWPYLDVKGLVTIGYGCLVDPIDRGLAAGVDESVWRSVKEMAWGMAATRYDHGWRMPAEAIEELALARLDADVQILEQVFGDLSLLPAEVQFAILSLAWACGAGWPHEFPHGTTAVLAGRWACPVCVSATTRAEFVAHRTGCLYAAAQLKIHEDGNPGVVPRNWRNVDLLRRAAGATATLT